MLRGRRLQWNDLNGTNQQFKVAESPDGYVRLINRVSGMAVEVHNGSKTDGGKVVQNRDWGGANQQWRLVPAGHVSMPPTTGGGSITSQAPSGTRPSSASSPAAGGAMAAAAAMQPGWNLGNALDAVGYTVYPNSPAETLKGETLKYLEYPGHYARTKKITTMLWDNGEHFNRKTLKWRDSQLIDLVKSSGTTRSGTASSDQLFVARSSPITSKTLTLNPNGTTFQGLRVGNADLARGADYTVSGNQLTLTASALTRMLGSREYGLNAILMVRFSDGTPWRISVITHDTPILSNATGATSSFAIPTQFRSDQLAKMEAKYADGSNAGPEGWTPFKPYDTSFVPNGNAIMLKPDFFAEVKDGARVTLTFHFWSGATVTYVVTKSGNRVTGTTS